MNKDGFGYLDREQKLQDKRLAHVARRRMFMQFFAARGSTIIHDFFIERCHRMHEGSEVT
jgi:hypothetical protein